MSDINPDNAHQIQDRMALALADYNAAHSSTPTSSTPPGGGVSP